MHRLDIKQMMIGHTIYVQKRLVEKTTAKLMLPKFQLKLILLLILNFIRKVTYVQGGITIRPAPFSRFDMYIKDLWKWHLTKGK